MPLFKLTPTCCRYHCYNGKLYKKTFQIHRSSRWSAYRQLWRLLIIDSVLLLFWKTDDSGWEQLQTLLFFSHRWLDEGFLMWRSTYSSFTGEIIDVFFSINLSSTYIYIYTVYIWREREREREHCPAHCCLFTTRRLKLRLNANKHPCSFSKNNNKKRMQHITVLKPTQFHLRSSYSPTAPNVFSVTYLHNSWGSWLIKKKSFLQKMTKYYNRKHCS